MINRLRRQFGHFVVGPIMGYIVERVEAGRHRDGDPVEEVLIETELSDGREVRIWVAKGIQMQDNWDFRLRGLLADPTWRKEHDNMAVARIICLRMKANTVQVGLNGISQLYYREWP